MTAALLILTFLLVLDVLVLRGWSRDSRDGRDWQPRLTLAWDRESPRGLVADRPWLGGFVSLAAGLVGSYPRVEGAA
jgi:hypothetical protein